MGTYNPFSFPLKSATYSSNAVTVSSSPNTSSPVGAVKAHSIIGRLGDVTVSLRRSTTFRRRAVVVIVRVAVSLAADDVDDGDVGDEENEERSAYGWLDLLAD